MKKLMAAALVAAMFSGHVMAQGAAAGGKAAGAAQATSTTMSVAVAKTTFAVFAATVVGVAAVGASANSTVTH